jgi:hypothetical protein
MSWFHIVACRPISGQQLGKHIPMATDMNATIEEQCFFYAVNAEKL